MTSRTGVSITVIGIGNPIMGDDGIGLEILRRLQASYAGTDIDLDELSWVPRTSTLAKESPLADVQFIDGGTSGMDLLPTIQDAENLLLFDALAGPGSPGTVVTLEGDQIPRLLKAKLSPHQVGLLDLLSAARLLGKEPGRVCVVGIVAEDCQLNVGLTPTVAAAIDEGVVAARAVVDGWLAN